MAARFGGLLNIVGKHDRKEQQSDPSDTRVEEPSRSPPASQEIKRVSEDPENSPQPSPDEPEASVARQRWNDPKINIGRVCTACLILCVNGMNDSAPGALLPSIEQHYDIDYIIVSMIFICNAAGFIAAAFWVHALDRRIGRAYTLTLNEALTIGGYIILTLVPPFPVFAIAYFITGVGMATNLALNNVFVANLANSNRPLSVAHGCYGLGGLLAPTFATVMISHGVPFQRFFLIMLGLRVVSFFLSGLFFRGFENDNTFSHDPKQLDPAKASPNEGPVKVNYRQKLRNSTLWQGLKNRYTLAGSLFIFAYQGAEVAISGWVISFLITTRGGDPSKVGYVTSGFWGGITFGRLVLNLAAPYLGERLFVYLLIAGSAAFQLVVWLAPNVIADAVATAMLGVLLGPVYPSSTAVFARLLPRGLQNSSLAFISSAGSSGGALAPFLVGIIAQSKGTYVLHPICIALYAVMFGCWAIITKGFHKHLRND